jgi:hypothetical protein
VKEKGLKRGEREEKKTEKQTSKEEGCIKQKDR